VAAEAVVDVAAEAVVDVDVEITRQRL